MKISIVLLYTSHTYSDALDMQPEVSYIPYAKSSHEKAGGITTFSQFEEGNLVGNKCNTE